ncbi:unnamed protein product [Pseudo-nitzschia multistriata]|uniref:Uncharacterized protein n=1 Tax=Pseudo-nitzschia multistriata TaxID=183589 RepID=A0A448ZG88_9STRA|nr:unnamed protein product [Pseudo-nitzschia multistriata]
MSSSSSVEKLVVEFNKSGKKEHLRFSPSWYGIPSGKTLSRDIGKVESVGKFSRESESGSRSGTPSNEGSHRHTPVLDFCMSEPRNSFVTSQLRKSKRIIDFSQLQCVRGGQNFVTGEFDLGDGLAGTLRRRKGRSGGDPKGKESDGRLHFGYC